MEYDDEVAFHARQKLYQLSRQSEDAARRPWCLTVSFTHPHDPYVARRKYWDLYENSPALDPQVAAIPFDQQDPHSQRLLHACDHTAFDITPEQVRRARRGYLANISYIDDKVGELIETLETTRMLDDTIIVFTSDHGDMLGDRGLWFKMNFFEGSARAPADDRRQGHPAAIDQASPSPPSTSTRRLGALAGIDIAEILPWTDGEDLTPLLNGKNRGGPVLMEYAAEGSNAPLRCQQFAPANISSCIARSIRRNSLILNPIRTPELTNLADDPAFSCRQWQNSWLTCGSAGISRPLTLLCAKVRRGAGLSMRRCAMVLDYPWDYQPLQKASERYMRNHMDSNVLEENARYPRGE